ncbi:hypothetical protein [Xanthobacter tagetidis]|jgi:hypothetical protein|uniref:Uncharacterized protein n=1 Tax=Xanthobacter tagetidis TaxID=60216 RepID=A0A3L7AK63_9HYPH|nr:hypothetical protein [Xanthobacter tagetidis]MBB6306960.1 hypothetical protein [Xanthobacter tagetidis]RLP79978.1 hypothetical protein D9R14_06360 [Xanthobacter tagetidis]
MYPDDTLRKLVLPLILLTALLASAATTGPMMKPAPLPRLDPQAVAQWREATVAAQPLIGLGN